MRITFGIKQFVLIVLMIYSAHIAAPVFAQSPTTVEESNATPTAQPAQSGNNGESGNSQSGSNTEIHPTSTPSPSGNSESSTPTPENSQNSSSGTVTQPSQDSESADDTDEQLSTGTTSSPQSVSDVDIQDVSEKGDITRKLNQATAEPMLSARMKRNTRLRDLSRKLYQANESVMISVEKSVENGVSLLLINPEGKELKVLYKKRQFQELVQYEIAPPQAFVPGTYTVRVTDSSGQTFEQDFTWGVLAINSDKSVYSPNETAQFSFAVLDEKGSMVCDANVKLTITNESQNVNTTLSTEDGSIKVNPECSFRGYTPNPDFEATYELAGTGIYKLKLHAQTKNGDYSIEDKIEVLENVPLNIERTGPTRVYPPVDYEVGLNVIAEEDFEGYVEEIVPLDFSVNPVEETPYESSEITSLNSVGAVLGASTFQSQDLEMPFDGEYKITARFGEHYDDRTLLDKILQLGVVGHDGVDFKLEEGTIVKSVDSGTVTHAKNNPYGLTVKIEHSWGTTYYGHLSELHVKEGDSVEKGQTIGLSGNTGISTAPHLHFALKPKDTNVDNGYNGMQDPLPYLGMHEGSVLSAQSDFRPDVRVLRWAVKLKKGESKLLKYSFKAPSKSPEFYLLGPAKLTRQNLDEHNAKIDGLRIEGQAQAEVTFQETRRWQIAVDTAITQVSDRQLGVSTATNSWTQKASITLTQDGSWLVFTSFDFGVDNAGTNGEVRLHQDDTTVLQYGRYEDMIATESYKSWFWMTRVERSGSNVTLDLDFKSRGASVTARIRNAVIVAIRLDDLGTEDTDWRWNSDNSTFSNLNSTFNDSDGIILTETWTPSTEEDWIIIADAEYTANSTSVNAEIQLSHNDETTIYDYAEHEGEDTAEMLWWSSLRVLTLPTSSQKFEIQVRGDSGTVVDAQRGRFFAVREAVFDQVVEFRSDSFTSPTSADNWEEKLNASFTPNQTEDVLILGHAGIAFGATGRIARTRIHEAESTAVMNNDTSGADTQSIWTTAIADVINMSSLYNADLDINASNTGVTFGDAAVVFVSLTLAGGGGGINISGTCDQYDQTTDCSDDGSNEIKVAYDGTIQSTVDTTVDGSWQITGITAPSSGQVVTVFINGESTASERANAVTKYDGSGDITGVKLFQRHLTIGSDDAPTVSNTNISQYDNGVSGDSDIFFEVDGNDDLAVDTSSAYTDEKLYVLSGTTYQPGTGNSSNVATHDFQNLGTTDITANTMTVNGSWTQSGTFSDTCSGTTVGTNASLVNFTSTSTGETLSGTLNSSSNFCKVNFNGSGGGWTIQDSMLVSSENATDTFSVTAGSVTLGNGGGDHLDVRGRFSVSSGATFQSMTGLAQGDTTTCNSDDICIEINANSSPPSCSNCTIENSGTFDIDKNVTVRFNSNASVESGINNSSTGYLEVQGTQDDTGTDTGTSSSSTRETQLCASESWTNDQHNNKYVRMTDGLARGRIYLITDTLDQDSDSNCATGSHDAITFDDTSSATDASPTVSCSGNKCVITSSVETLVTADNDHVGRYIHDVTGTEGYYLIIDSTESGSDTITVIGNPSTLALATNDDIEVTDGIRSGDGFEILDYAEVTADATNNGFIHNASGSEMIMRYAKVSEMGAETANKYGINGASVNAANSSEGFLVEKSYITNSHRSVRCDSCSNLTVGNTSGVHNNYIYNASQEGVDISNNVLEVTGNRVDTVAGNGEAIITYAGSRAVYKDNIVSNCVNCIVVMIGSGGHTIVGNKVYDGTIGITSNDSEENIIVDNDVFSTSAQGIYVPTTENIYLGSNRVDVGTVHFDTSNSSATNVIAAEELYGYYSGASTADVRYQSTGAHKSRFYNSYFGSSTEVSGITTSNAYLASFKHDQSSGASRIWNDYVVPDSSTETPQSEETQKHNYANNLWEDSSTPHYYVGTGTEDTDIDVTFGSALSQVEVYRATVTTANGDNPTFTVTRSGGTASPTTCAFSGGTCTYTEATTGVQFTLTDGGTNHVVGDTYTFMVFPDSNDSNSQKSITMMQDNDTFTIGSGETIELKGVDGTNTLVQKDSGSSSGYAFTVSGGAIDANYYTFTGQSASGLNLSSGTITNLDNGTFDNHAGVGASDTYITVTSTLLDSTGAQTWTGLYFDNDTTDSAVNYNVLLSGTPSGCSNAWTFESDGNIGGDVNGEANDSDGGDGGGCNGGEGYLLWDDIPTGPTNNQLMRHGDWFNNAGVRQYFTF